MFMQFKFHFDRTNMLSLVCHHAQTKSMHFATRINGNFYEYKLLLMDDTQRTRLEG